MAAKDAIAPTVFLTDAGMELKLGLCDFKGANLSVELQCRPVLKTIQARPQQVTFSL